MEKRREIFYLTAHYGKLSRNQAPKITPFSLSPLVAFDAELAGIVPKTLVALIFFTMAAMVSVGMKT